MQRANQPSPLEQLQHLPAVLHVRRAAHAGLTESSSCGAMPTNKLGAHQKLYTLLQQLLAFDTKGTLLDPWQGWPNAHHVRP
jgi:hypothetical protein